MEYILLMILTILYVSQNFFCARYAGCTKASESVSSFIYLFYLGIILAVVTFFYNCFAFSVSGVTVALATVAALMLVCYYLALVTASKIGSYMMLMVFLLFGGIIIPVAVDCIISHTMLSFQKTAGVLLMLIAILLYNVEPNKKIAEENNGKPDKQSRKNKIICYICYIALFISNGTYSAVIVAQQRLESGAHEKEMLIITFIFASLMCFVSALAMKNRRNICSELAIGKKAAFMLAIAAFSGTAAVNLLQIVLKKISPTVVLTVDNGGNLFLAALLAYLVFKEKFTLNKIIGTVVIIVSIMLLCL